MSKLILWDPAKYDAWYETPLGSLSDRLEKGLVYSMVGATPGERVLDVGCGTGNYTLDLARKGCVVTGVDSSKEMLALARLKADDRGLDAAFHVADACALPFQDNFFDLIISVGLLCFLKYPEKALTEMNRVLMPEGRIVIGVLNSRSPWALFRRIKGLFKDTVYNQARFISPTELEGLMRRNGFAVKDVETCLFFLPINWSPYLKLALSHERLGKAMMPGTGAFLATCAVKAGYKRL